MKLTKSQIKVLGVIYLATDCSNEVYDAATLHHTQVPIAKGMPGLVMNCGPHVAVDGDGFVGNTERWSDGYRLTQRGYEALTEVDPLRWPANLRRFQEVKS